MCAEDNKIEKRTKKHVNIFVKLVPHFSHNNEDTN